MKIGCCIGIEHYDALVALGFDSITLSCVDVSTWSDEQFEQVLCKIRKGPLQLISLNQFCPPSLKLTGPNADLDSIKEYTTKLCNRAARLGIRYIGIGAPKSRSFEMDSNAETAEREFAESVQLIARIAEQFGLEILVESVCGLECNLITTTEHALRFVRNMNMKNLHLVYDIYHEIAESQPLSIIRDAAEEIRVVHIAQNVDNARHYLDPKNIEEYRSYWNALQEAGYSGEFSLEAFCGDLSVELPLSMQIIQKIKEK